MHREIRDQIEEVLADSKPRLGAGTSEDYALKDTQQHLVNCSDCRAEVESMQEQAALLHELRAPEGFAADPRPGFYARVMERIEAEGPISIWNLFIESAFGRRIAVASMALALLLGVYLVSVERSVDEPITASEQSEPADRQNLAGQTVAGEDAPGR